MLKIGLLGVGAIGRTIATALDQKQVDAELVALSDQDCARAEALSSELSNHPPVLPVEEMIDRCELAVEAASQAALPDFVPKALARGRDMLIMSVGGLLGREEWFREASAKGLPNLRSLRRHRGPRWNQVRLDWANRLRGIDQPQAREGARRLEVRARSRDSTRRHERGHGHLRGLSRRRRPSVSDNVERGGIAALGRRFVGQVRVRVVAVPGGSENVHEIRVQGEFGRLSMRVENVPSKTNPRTSQLAAFSAIATLKNLTRSLRVGT